MVVPAPFLVNEPMPLIAPLKVEVVPASAKSVPPRGVERDRFARSDPAASRQRFERPAVKAECPAPQIAVAVYCEDAPVEVRAASVGVRSRQVNGPLPCFNKAPLPEIVPVTLVTADALSISNVVVALS